MNETHSITSIGENDEETTLEDAAEVLTDLFIKPFWKSTIIRVGAVVVAVTIVKTAGRIIIARNNAKFGV
jgi:ABC-type glycerol-3-phosphate transport system permease component